MNNFDKAVVIIVTVKNQRSRHLLPVITLLNSQAAAFGLRSVVYVPKIQLDTVTALSDFCEKASMVRLSDMVIY